MICQCDLFATFASFLKLESEPPFTAIELGNVTGKFINISPFVHWNMCYNLNIVFFFSVPFIRFLLFHLSPVFRLNAISHSSSRRSTFLRQNWRSSACRSSAPWWRMSSYAWSSRPSAAATLNMRAYRATFLRQKVSLYKHANRYSYTKIWLLMTFSLIEKSQATELRYNKLKEKHAELVANHAELLRKV